MGDKKIQFRKSMGGYNREDVNRFIEEMSARNYDNETELRKQNEELEKKIKKLEEENAEIITLGDSISQLQEKLEQSENLISSLNETISKLNSEKDVLFKENTELKERVAECEKTEKGDSEVYEKSNKYDQVSGQIGSLILNANAKAEAIVSEAQIKARVNSAQMIDRTVDNLCYVNEKYISEITAKAVQLTDELRSLSLTADACRTTVQAGLENERIQLKESLEETKRIVIGEDQ